MIKIHKRGRRCEEWSFIQATCPIPQAIFAGTLAGQQRSKSRYNKVYEDNGITRYVFYSSLYQDRDISELRDLPEISKPHDFEVFVNSQNGLEKELTNTQFLQAQDFAIINDKRSKMLEVPVGFLIPDMTEDETSVWEYGEVFINFNNRIRIKWKH